MDIIRNSYPRANKDHKCMFCGGVIKKSEVYSREVIKTDYIYTWISHTKCFRLCRDLNMCGYHDYGVDSESFMQYVYDFIYKKVSDEEFDDLFGEDAVNKAIEILDKKGV